MTDGLEQVTLTAGEKRIPLQVVHGTEGPSGIAIAPLLSSTGMVTLDPGFMNTGSCQSAVSYIDGDAGILRYRGYPIEQLARTATFTEVAYLLVKGELPTADQLAAWDKRLKKHTQLHANFAALISAFPRQAHPMAVLSALVSALPGFYPQSISPADPEQVELATVLLLAKAPTIAAYAHRHSHGEDMPAPSREHGFATDILRMSFGADDIDPLLVRALEVLLILHADHEQNCSTSTVRIVGSARANLYASVSAGINALSGPAHGGANESVMKMLAGIRDDTDGSSAAFMRRVKDRGDSTRLMGFGHRVYKNYDPRALIVKEIAHQVFDVFGNGNELLDIARGLEDIALSDDYFIERKLYPNVDFYTGLIYSAMGFDNRMFTPLFAVGRMPGWIAQWREMLTDPQLKIGRPRQIYVGQPQRDYVPTEQRA